MKFILICALFVLPFNSISQKGFRLINKAETKIDKEKYTKALKLLNKAESSNYGFCGNSVIDAQQSIAINKVRIFDAQNEPLKAANKLNELSFYFGKNLDSLKMTYFLKAIDKAQIKQQIDSCLNALDSIKYDDFYFGFPLNVRFSDKPLEITYETMRLLKRSTYVDTEKNKNQDISTRFINAVKNEPFYLLLM